MTPRVRGVLTAMAVALMVVPGARAGAQTPPEAPVPPLTDEQRARIRELWNEAQRQAGERRQAVRVLQDELLRELTRPELDPRVIETVRRKLAAESDWLSQHMTQALVNVYSVLTPAQREKVGKSMQEQARRQRERHEQDDQARMFRGDGDIHHHVREIGLAFLRARNHRSVTSRHRSAAGQKLKKLSGTTTMSLPCRTMSGIRPFWISFTLSGICIFSPLPRSRTTVHFLRLAKREKPPARRMAE